MLLAQLVPARCARATAERYFGEHRVSSGCSVELAPQAKGQTWEFDDASKTVTSITTPNPNPNPTPNP